MKKTLTIIAMLFMALTSFAQKDPAAKKVLDATAAKLGALKNIRSNFEVTQFNGNNQSSETIKGTILLSGKKYKVEAPGSNITWFDGKTQWVYIPENEEVNLSEPTKEKQATMNPYAFIGLYKKGYNYSMNKTTLNGSSVYEIRLTAESASADIQEARLNISMDYIPVSVRIRQGKKTWTRIRVSGLQGKQKFSSDTFTFPASKYPDAELIDLR